MPPSKAPRLATGPPVEANGRPLTSGSGPPSTRGTGRYPLRGTGRPPFRGIRPPQPGPGRAVPDLPQTPDRLWKRLYVRGGDDELEKFYGYSPGGYHPIDLQNELGNGRYRVIHKLGHGGYATVWLCREQHVDPPTYAAVKVLVGNQMESDDHELVRTDSLRSAGIEEEVGSQHLCFPRGHFTSRSPSGTHICLVYPLLGPPVQDAAKVFDDEENADEMLRSVSRQTVQALAALHERGICHGDFRPSNILLELQDLEGRDEDQVLSLLGEPVTTRLCMREDSRPAPEMPYAPKHVVYSVDFEGDVDPSCILPRVQVIDFGQSFDTTRRSPPAVFGIPANYAAPEVALDGSGSLAMDLWSLGCTLYEIRLGRRLFDVFQLIGFRKKHYMDEISPLLGEPPDRWEKYYEEPESESGGNLSRSGSDFEADSNASITSQEDRVEAIGAKLASCNGCVSFRKSCTHEQFQLISRSEAAVFSDLLEKLLRYRPEERLSAQDVLEHPWFADRSEGQTT